MTNSIEVRKQVYPKTEAWTLYGHDINGVEFGVVFESKQALQEKLFDLLVSMESSKFNNTIDFKLILEHV